jgi:hypothetical protein
MNESALKKAKTVPSAGKVMASVSWDAPWDNCGKKAKGDKSTYHDFVFFGATGSY